MAQIDSDSPRLFETPQEAARAALAIANPQSIEDNLEYGGLIYQSEDGRFGFSGPEKGNETAFNSAAAPVPRGSLPVGVYHTHGDYSRYDPETGRAARTSDPALDDYNSDEFSRSDKDVIAFLARVPGYRGYLGTPSGRFLEYDPITRRVSPL